MWISFSYEWGFLDSTNNETIIPNKDNVILIIDKVSEMYIMGSEIDCRYKSWWVVILKSIVALTTSSCGCGESFSVWLFLNEQKNW